MTNTQETQAGKVHYETEWKGKVSISCNRPASRATRDRTEVTCQRCINAMPGRTNK